MNDFYFSAADSVAVAVSASVADTDSVEVANALQSSGMSSGRCSMGAVTGVAEAPLKREASFTPLHLGDCDDEEESRAANRFTADWAMGSSDGTNGGGVRGLRGPEAVNDAQPPTVGRGAGRGAPAAADAAWEAERSEYGLILNWPPRSC